jgi:hypothetical protein
MSQQLRNSVIVSIDNEIITFPDQQPRIMASLRDQLSEISLNMIYVPIGIVFDELDFNVEWISERRLISGTRSLGYVRITKGSYTIIVRDKEAFFTVNGRPIAYPGGGIAQIVFGRVMVPPKEILECAGYTVGWDNTRVDDVVVGTVSIMSREFRMMDNLVRDTSLPIESDERRNSMVVMGRTLLNEGYEPAFVAGMLGNIMREGSFGQFERDWGGPIQAYLRFVPNYGTEYSNQNITSKNLSTVRNLLLELQSQNWNNGKFGLGCIQWTDIRTLALVDVYLEVTGGSNSINFEQVARAEGLMVSRELRNPPLPDISDYRLIYPNWQSANNSKLSAEDAAYDAGHRLCMNYLIPNDRVTKAVQRGNDAKAIYNVMTS